MTTGIKSTSWREGRDTLTRGSVARDPVAQSYRAVLGHRPHLAPPADADADDRLVARDMLPASTLRPTSNDNKKKRVIQ
jgi:hypothetical protein